MVSIHCMSKETGANVVCSGTVVNPEHILTSATCVIQCNSFRVRYGFDSLNSGGQVIEATSTFVHPEFDALKNNMNYNVALIRTDPGALKSVVKVPLNRNNELPIPKEVFACGWPMGSVNQSNQLQCIHGQLIEILRWNINMLSVYFENDLLDQNYNLGAPLLVKLNEQMVQVGIATALRKHHTHYGLFIGLADESIRVFIDRIINNIV